MHYLVRIYQPQRDKINVEKNTFEEALKLINQTKHNVKTRVKWLNIEDVYFNDTKNYIRIVN